MAGITRSGKIFRSEIDSIVKSPEISLEIQQKIKAVLESNPTATEFTVDQFPGITFSAKPLATSNTSSQTPTAANTTMETEGAEAHSGSQAGEDTQSDIEIDVSPPPKVDPFAKYSINSNIKELGTPDGSNKKKLLAWLKSLDGLGSEAPKYAFHTSKGRLRRYLEHSQEPSWELLRGTIIHKFLGPDFADEQLNRLLNITQTRDQSILEYIQEVESILRDACEYNPSTGATSLVKSMEPTIVKALIRGLNNPRLVQAIREKEPTCLEEAFDLIEKYQYIVPQPKSSRVSTIDDLADLKQEILNELKQVRIDAAPVAPSNPPKHSVQCHHCGKTGHYARDCRHRSQPKPTFQCFRCGDPGHGVKDCPHPVQGATPVQNPSGKCERCTRVGHVVKDCIAGPPKNPCRVCSGKHWRYDCPNKTQSPSEQPKNS